MHNYGACKFLSYRVEVGCANNNAQLVVGSWAWKSRSTFERASIYESHIKGLRIIL